ncbi:aspartoacylase [Prochlorococcus sp. MIT 1300]|uniref:aspartoacylase n=1 Tax=Prochlorococcus sp. MIT 1300 TaxID=3096218 RepID=UPI002A763B13|nr:aspartoacylase [Prochlorococcus sp. MIT 1300]
MSPISVLLVAGTHGNEVNAPWLFDQWSRNPDLIDSHDLELKKVIGNPAALSEGKRYIHSDLNRSFRKELLNSSNSSVQEVLRAKELVRLFGPNGKHSCKFAIDLHSTTSSMGSSIVIYGRRSVDLAVASLIQYRLGLPVYLHEGDPNQQGFLVENWPCGLVIEIGPVPQGVLKASIIEKTRLALSASLDCLAKLSCGEARFPNQLVLHRHIQSLDLPRDSDGQPIAVLHPEIQGRDWQPIEHGSPLFIKANGEIIRSNFKEKLVPVFINEAAYLEKKIALSLTKREVLAFDQNWAVELNSLLFS